MLGRIHGTSDAPYQKILRPPTLILCGKGNRAVMCLFAFDRIMPGNWERKKNFSCHVPIFSTLDTLHVTIFWETVSVQLFCCRFSTRPTGARGRQESFLSSFLYDSAFFP